MSLLFAVGLFLFIFEVFNLYCSVQHNKIFMIGFHYKTNKDMSVFQIKQEMNKSFSLGHWYHEHESSFKSGVVINVICLFVSIWLLVQK